MGWLLDLVRGRRGTRDNQNDGWGAIGAGWVLVLLPSAALFFGAAYLELHQSIGLPLLAVFGIMVLFGSLAMTSTLFQRLALTSKDQPLALPPGSVRATMALALIVLFAIIAIAAMRPPQELKHLEDVSGTLRAELLRDPRITVVKSKLERCVSTVAGPALAPGSVIALAQPQAPAAAPTACAAADERYSMVVKVGPDASSQELVKQLVLTIGQLMTMAVSFYFATRKSDAGNDGPGAGGADPKPQTPPHAPQPDPTGADVPAGAAGPAAIADPGAAAPVVVGPGPRAGKTFDIGAADLRAETHDEHDGCGGAGQHCTADEDLPEAQGGIAKS